MITKESRQLIKALKKLQSRLSVEKERLRLTLQKTINIRWLLEHGDICVEDAKAILEEENLEF